MTARVSAAALIAAVFGCLIAIAFSLKKIREAGPLALELPRKGAWKYLVAVPLALALASVNFFREWTAFVGVVFSLFGAACAVWCVYDFFRSKYAGIYEKAVIAEGVLLPRSQISDAETLNEISVRIFTEKKNALEIYIGDERIARLAAEELKKDAARSKA